MPRPPVNGIEVYYRDGGCGPAVVLESMMGLLDGPVHVVGHSYGGSIAARTALRHPERVNPIVEAHIVGNS